MLVKLEQFEAWKTLLEAEELPGRESHRHGVAFMLPKHQLRCVIDYKPVRCGDEQRGMWDAVNITITTGVHLPNPNLSTEDRGEIEEEVLGLLKLIAPKGSALHG